MKKYTLEELLAVEISKIIRDDEMNFTGHRHRRQGIYPRMRHPRWWR